MQYPLALSYLIMFHISLLVHTLIFTDVKTSDSFTFCLHMGIFSANLSVIPYYINILYMISLLFEY